LGAVFPGIPADLARQLVEGLGLTRAVETGTHLGDSTRALRGMVPEMWTVELSPDYMARAREALEDLDNIHFVAGSSDEVLRTLAPTIDQPAVYWLDAHWCELGTAGASAQCPVLAEIEAVDTAPAGDRSVILIDDARFFLGAPLPTYRREDWPTFMEVVDALRARHDRYVTVLADVVIATPLEGRKVVEAWYLSTVFRDLRDERDSALAQREAATADALAVRAAWEAAVDPSLAVALRRVVKAAMPKRLRARIRGQA
jgi:hypothetical protein